MSWTSIYADYWLVHIVNVLSFFIHLFWCRSIFLKCLDPACHAADKISAVEYQQVPSEGVFCVCNKVIS